MILKNYVNGQFVWGEQTFDNINPVNGSLICQVSEATEDVVDQAVRAARAALVGEWGKLSVNDRCDLLHAVADGIGNRFDEFVDAEIRGSNRSSSSSIEPGVLT